MNILILGGKGFIGRHVAAALQAQGHVVNTPTHQDVDFLALSAASVRPYLAGSDVVINCVGVMSRHAKVLEQVHHHAPKQLAKWAKEEGCTRWVQLSVLGADAHDEVVFTGSKGRGDEALLASGLSCAIGRASVVFGRGGASCALFVNLARLPILMLPEGGHFEMQPVHVRDVAAGLADLALNPSAPAITAMVGQQACSLAEYFQMMRQSLHGRGPMRIVPLPMGCLKPWLPITNRLTNGMLSRASMALLTRGSVADVGPFCALLGHNPLSYRQFGHYFDEQQHTRCL